jgi:hypothetical protein
MDELFEKYGRFNKIPDEYKNRELYFYGYENCLIGFYKIPEEYKDQEFYTYFYEKNAIKLKDIPQAYRNRDICLLSCKRYKCGDNINPEIIDKQEFYDEVLKENICFYELLLDEYKTYDLSLEYIKCENPYIKFVPKKFRYYNLYLTGVKNKLRLTDVEEKYLDKELIIAALENNIDNFYDLPEKLITYELCLYVMEKDARFYESIPLHFRDKKLTDIVICEKKYNIYDIPEEFRTREMILECLEEDDEYYWELPKELTDDVNFNVECILRNISIARHIYETPELKNKLKELIKYI